MSDKSWMKEFYPVDADLVDEKDAIKHSLVKWYGLRKESLEKHGLTEPPIDIDDSSCALCRAYYSFYEVTRCSKCPLYQYLGRPCASILCGTYEFDHYTDKGDPEPMIAALEAISFVEDTCK